MTKMTAMHKLFTHCLQILQYLLLSLTVLWAAVAQATSCPHEADIVFNGINSKTILMVKGATVNLTGTMHFKIIPTGVYARDTCIMTFESWTNTTGTFIGGGLYVVTGKASYPVVVNGQWTTSNTWPNYSSGSMNSTAGECSYQYSGTDASDYRWGGRFSATAVGIGLWDNNFVHAKSGCNTMYIDVPITIKGTYDGSTVTLYPKNKNISWNSTEAYGLYTMAAGEHNEYFNPSAPFQANQSQTTPYVIKERALGCSKSAATAASNSLTYTTLTQLPANQTSAELARFTAYTQLSDCLFASTDVVTFKPRQISASVVSPLNFESSTTINGIIAQEMYGFNCANCANASSKENLKILFSRSIQGLNAQGASCNPSISISNDSSITASNLSTCVSLKMSIQTQVVQTGTLLNTTTTSLDPNNLSKIYGFETTQVGSYAFNARISGQGLSTLTNNISTQRFDLTAPFVPGCNSLATTYPLPAPDQILATLSLSNNQAQSLGVFSSQTTLDKCALDNTKTIGVSGLTLNPANSGTPTQLILLSSSTSGPQTLIQRYKLKINSCASPNPADCINENLVLKVTRNALAFNSTNAAGCSPTYSNTNDQLSVGNMSKCDALVVNHQTEVLQTGTVMNAEPYVFANALATFNLTAPMVDATRTQSFGISNKVFQVFPYFKGKCQVVVKSSIQRK